MSARLPDLRKTIDHMPPAAILVLQDVSWEEYEDLLEDVVDRPGVRITYDEGRLEIVTTSRKHEKYKSFITRVMHILSEELDLNVEGSGGATWKRKRDAKGTEADDCFHIANANRVIGRDEVDLNKEPGPDLAIEIDLSNQSLSKLPIYAAFEVSEVWRYVAKKKSLMIYELRGGIYLEIEASRSFPILTREVIAGFLEMSAVEGQTRALKAFRKWLKDRLTQAKYSDS